MKGTKTVKTKELPEFKTISELSKKDKLTRLEKMLVTQQEKLFDLDIEIYFIENFEIPELKNEYAKKVAIYAAQHKKDSRQQKRENERNPQGMIGKLELDGMKAEIDEATSKYSTARAKTVDYIEVIKALIASHK